ncbi:MAG: hypothetical protein IPH45_00380 [Bacteroidales bacterium]|nr:hypothetical protein [Bacteroidales bacterium]
MDIRDKRASTEEVPVGTANGDVYVQTRILLFEEQKIRPSVILNSTLKTASAKIIMSNKNIEFENSISGYSGWMNNGDHPMVFSSQLTHKNKRINFFGQYQYGIRDFPYHHIRLGLLYQLKL